MMSSLKKILIIDQVSVPVLVGMKNLIANGFDVQFVTWSSKVRRVALLGIGVSLVKTIKDPEDKDFAHLIETVVRQIDPHVIIPFSFRAWTGLVKIPAACNLIPTVSPEKYSIVNNKDLCRQFFSGTEFYQPRRYRDIHEANALAVEYFPLVVKISEGTGVYEGVRYVSNWEELLSCIGEFKRQGLRIDDLVIEEFVPGVVFDIAGIAWEGKVADMIIQKRSISFPISGGVGAINVTVDDPSLERIGARIINNSNYTGPFQIEVKLVGEKFFVVEFNPKFWGTLDLSVKAGKNFPADLVRLKLGETFVRDYGAYEKNLMYKFNFPQWGSARSQLKARYGNAFKLAIKSERVVTDFCAAGFIHWCFSMLQFYLGGQVRKDPNYLVDPILEKGLEINVENDRL